MSVWPLLLLCEKSTRLKVLFFHTIEVEFKQPLHLQLHDINKCDAKLKPCTLSIGPYTNILDLQLFPSMSHRHSAQLQMYDHTEANIEQTWRTVETVWSETSSSEVARAFRLALSRNRAIMASSPTVLRTAMWDGITLILPQGLGENMQICSSNYLLHMS